MIAKISSIVLAATIVIVGHSTSFAQKKHGEFETFTDRIYWGGTIGMTIGSHLTQIDVVPMGGIWILPQWSLGLGGRYTYRKERFSYIAADVKPYKTHIWGLSGFTQVLPIADFDDAFGIGIHGGIILHGEFEALYLDRKYFDVTSNEGRGWIQMYLVGGGYRQRIGDRAALNLLVLWDLTDNRYSPYTSNPILRLSITF